MQYLIMIYGDERAQNEAWERMSEEERKARTGEWYAYTRALKDADAFVGGEALQPTATAKTVRMSDGERLVTDGPFAETKEQLGGYYIVDVDSEEEALDWAARIPSLPHGSVEVRPVMVFPDEPPA